MDPHQVRTYSVQVVVKSMFIKVYPFSNSNIALTLITVNEQKENVHDLTIWVYYQ